MLLNFSVEINPLSDIRSFQIALTRFGEGTEVHVDWSRSVHLSRNIPR